MNRTAALSGAVIAVNDAVVLNTLFLIFSLIQTDRPLQPGALPWAVCAAGFSAASARFLRKPRAVPALAAFHVLGFGVLLTVLLAGLGTGAGPGPVFFCVLFSLISAARISYLALRPATLSQLIAALDVLLICAGFYSLVAARGGFPPEYPAVLLGALVLNMVTLTYSRAHGGEDCVRCATRWEGALVFGVSCGSVGAFLLLAGLFSSGAREAAARLSTLLVEGLRTLGRTFLRLLEAILSLLPPPEETVDEPPDYGIPGGAAAPDAPLEMEFDPSRLIPLAVLAGVAILTVSVLLILRLRRVRLGGRSPHTQAVSVRVSRVRGILRRRLRARWSALRFFLRAWYYRDTPGGALLFAERWGRRHKLPRGRGETHRAYLLRLTTGPAAPEDGLPALLAKLADALDRRYYAPGRTPPPMTAREFRQIRAALRRRAQDAGKAGFPSRA